MSVFISDIDTDKLNFFKYSTALYKIFINGPLVQCAVSLKMVDLYVGLRVVA